MYNFKPDEKDYIQQKQLTISKDYTQFQKKARNKKTKYAILFLLICIFTMVGIIIGHFGWKIDSSKSINVLSSCQNITQSFFNSINVNSSINMPVVTIGNVYCNGSNYNLKFNQCTKIPNEQWSLGINMERSISLIKFYNDQDCTLQVDQNSTYILNTGCTSNIAFINSKTQIGNFYKVCNDFCNC